MKLHHFVSGSSAILAAWLAITFFYHLPAQRYLKLERSARASLAPAPSLTVTAADKTIVEISADFRSR